MTLRSASRLRDRLQERTGDRYEVSRTRRWDRSLAVSSYFVRRSR